MRIKKIIGLDGLTLIVYYTDGKCWQFAIIKKDGQLYQPQGIFYTADGAENEGRKWLFELKNS